MVLMTQQPSDEANHGGEMAEGATKSGQSYARLKAMILNFELRSGQPVSERTLEVQLQTSRTSVRAAIARLEAEGLMRRENRSYVVTPIDPDEIAAAHEFLLVIEPAAIRMACVPDLKARLDELSAIVRHVEQSDSVDDFISATLSFHKGLVALAANPFLIRAELDAATRLTRAAWLCRWLQREIRADWSDAHEVLARLRAGDRDAAAAALVRLLSRSKEQMVRLVRDEQRGLLARGIGVA